MAEEAWGRWGGDDERGALNLIGSKQTLHAMSLVKRGHIIPLSQDISPDLLVPPRRSAPIHHMSQDGGDYAAGKKGPSGFQYADDAIYLPLHVGTHIDCLCHVWYEGKLFNGYPESTVRSSGALRCSADKMGSIVTRGVLLDFVKLVGRPLEDGVSIDLAMLKEAIKTANVAIRTGDVVVLRTGWLEAQDQSGDADFNSEPGLNVEAAVFLAEAGAAVIGADNFAIEVLPHSGGQVFPVHQRLLRDFGVPLLEGLVLKPLAEQSVSEFLFVGSPLPIVGGTASPLAPIAVV